MYKPKWWEYFALFIGIVLLIWFVSCRFLVKSLKEDYEKGKIVPTFDNIEDLLKNVENGDLIFLSGDTQGERAIRMAHNSYYSHVGFLFVDKRGAIDSTPKNTVFIWESDLGQGYRDGPRIMRLWDKLSRWKGCKIGMIRKYSSFFHRPKTEEILNVAKPILDANIGMDISMTSWFFSDYPESKIFKFLKDDKVFCSGLVAFTLQKLGIMDYRKHPSWYTPENFASGKDVFVRGFYHYPVYFKF